VARLTEDIEALAILYRDEHLVPLSRPGDAFHLAFASVYETDILAT